MCTVILGDLECDETHPFFAAIADAVARNIDQFFATPRLRVKAGPS